MKKTHKYNMSPTDFYVLATGKMDIKLYYDFVSCCFVFVFRFAFVLFLFLIVCGDSVLLH